MVLGTFFCAVAAGVPPFSRARFISMHFDSVLSSQRKCLSFYYHAFGRDLGQLNVLDQYDNIVWSLETSTSEIHGDFTSL